MKAVLLATAWGPRHGGINAFNRDLAVSLAGELGITGEVFCAVPNPTQEDVAEASRNQVTLVPIVNKRHTDEFDDSWIYDVSSWLEKNRPGARIDVWLGHDVTSGAAALRAASDLGGSASLVHHMNYLAYQGYKHDNGPDTDQKHQRQRRLFEQHANLYAVGPLLTRSCRTFSNRTVTELIPGFPEFSKDRTLDDRASDSNMIGITFGRMEQASDRIKQGRLAVAGFGRAINQAGGSESLIRRLSTSQLYVIGLDSDWRKESKQINELAEKHAGRVVNILSLPFDQDRGELFRRLSKANLALMLSWHEGFGLTGWEAIAAEIPLILSQNSGLYQLIERTLHGAGTGCVQAIDVHGKRGDPGDDNFSPEDLENVSKAILKISENLAFHLNSARHLRELLVAKLGCTWRDTARQFLASSTDGRERLLGASPTTLNQHSEDKANIFSIQEPLNAVPRCAELTLTTTQGSLSTSFYLLPEVRFGRAEFNIESISVSYGLTEAILQASLTNCRIASGTRLGDSKETHPDVSAHGNNVWEIRGPKESGILMRRAIGDEPLCLIEASGSGLACVTLTVSCRVRDIEYKIVDPSGPAFSVTEERILGVFFSKCAQAENGYVALSSAALTAGVNRP